MKLSTCLSSLGNENPVVGDGEMICTVVFSKFVYCHWKINLFLNFACVHLHTNRVCKQSVEYGLTSIFNEKVFYFCGNGACLMLWNSNFQKFQKAKMDLSNAAPGNFKWTSKQLFTCNNQDLLWCPFNGVRFKSSCFFVCSSCGSKRQQWNFLK